MNGNDFIKTIGMTSDDAEVKAAIAACGINKNPRKKLNKDFGTAFVTNPKKGIELKFRDERFLEAKGKTYEEGSLVFVNARMYGDGYEDFKRFDGELPLGLRFEMGLKEVQATLGKKPASKGKDIAIIRWDFKGYSLFVVFNADCTEIGSVAVQMPVK
jgi:hypothetical protein